MVFKVLISLSVIVYVGEGMWVRSLRSCTHQVSTFYLFIFFIYFIFFFLPLWCISGSVLVFFWGGGVEHACACLCYLFGLFWIKLALALDKQHECQLFHWLSGGHVTLQKSFTATSNFSQLWHLNFNEIKAAPTADLQPTGRFSSVLWPPQLMCPQCAGSVFPPAASRRALGVSQERVLRSVESTEEVFLRSCINPHWANHPRRELPEVACNCDRLVTCTVDS